MGDETSIAEWAGELNVMGQFFGDEYVGFWAMCIYIFYFSLGWVL